MNKNTLILNYKLNFARIAIGIIFCWFGLLKFIPNASPAEIIAKETINYLTFGLLDIEVGYLFLAVLEVGLGVLLVLNMFLKKVVIITLCHLFFTFVPLFVFSQYSFEKPPFVFSLLGQYILKNIVIISLLLIIYPIQDTSEFDPNK